MGLAMNRAIIWWLFIVNFLMAQKCYEDYTDVRQKILTQLNSIYTIYYRPSNDGPQPQTLRRRVKLIDYFYTITKLPHRKVKIRIKPITPLPSNTNIGIEVAGKDAYEKEIIPFSTKTLKDKTIEVELPCGKFTILVTILPEQEKNIRKIIEQYQNPVIFEKKIVDTIPLCSNVSLEKLVDSINKYPFFDNNKCDSGKLKSFASLISTIENSINLYCDNNLTAEYERCKTFCSICKEFNPVICNECLLILKNEAYKLEIVLHITKYFRNIINYRIFVERLITFYDLLRNSSSYDKFKQNICGQVNRLFINNKTTLKNFLKKIKLEHLFYEIDTIFYLMCFKPSDINNFYNKTPFIVLSGLGKCAYFSKE